MNENFVFHLKIKAEDVITSVCTFEDYLEMDYFII